MRVSTSKSETMVLNWKTVNSCYWVGRELPKVKAVKQALSQTVMMRREMNLSMYLSITTLIYGHEHSIVTRIVFIWAQHWESRTPAAFELNVHSSVDVLSACSVV